jgi:hypothetical protein
MLLGEEFKASILGYRNLFLLLFLPFHWIRNGFKILQKSLSRIQKGHPRRFQNEPDHRCPQKGTTASIERGRGVSNLELSIPEEKNGEEV